MKKNLLSKPFYTVLIALVLSISLCYSCGFASQPNTSQTTIQKETLSDSNDSLSQEEIKLLRPTKIENEIILTRKSYIVSYNPETKIPNWVAWHLTKDHTDGYVERKKTFHEDEDVPEPRAENSDYKKSGYSRGHLCPAGDNKWDEEAMDESFLLTNICPQNANLNTGVWNQIEISTRRWAKTYGDVYVITGPILYNQPHKTIGENKVVVPEAFFKIIVCLNDQPKGIGFVCKNTKGGKKKDLYVNTIAQIERLTNLTFFPTLTKEISDQIKLSADINDWE